MYDYSNQMTGKGNPNYKHGFTGTPTFHSWQDMMQRCYNPHNKDWKYYGGRGIGVSNSWRDNFRKFLEDMGIKPEGKTLDRIHGDRDYSKDNCKWSTPLEQSRNRRRVYNRGEANSHARLSLEDVEVIRNSVDGAKRLAKQFGVSESTIYKVKSGHTWTEV